MDQLDESNSRPIYSCGALDISKDNDRIYFSEISAYPTASIEVSSYEEITISPCSFIWMYEFSSNSIQLVGRNFSSVTSLIIEYPESNSKNENSLLITESTTVSYNNSIWNNFYLIITK